MGLTVLDAGVVIAFFEDTDTHHEAAVVRMRLAIEGGDDLVLPASAYAEVLVGPIRRGDAAVASALQFVDDVPLRIESATRDVAETTAHLRARHGSRLRLPDALVIATAQRLQADRILTTDGRWPPVDVAVEVIGAA